MVGRGACARVCLKQGHGEGLDEVCGPDRHPRQPRGVRGGAGRCGGSAAVDRIAMLGDIVGYGADPDWCVRPARGAGGGGGAVRAGQPRPRGGAGRPRRCRTNAQRAHRLDAGAVDAGADRRFWRALPMTADGGEVLLVHASADSPEDWIYVTSDTEGGRRRSGRCGRG